MAYIDLGKFSFATGQDYTGLNTGNLTSVLDLSVINIPYFEMYRLVIDTTALSTVTPIPIIVQDSGMVTGTSLTTLNITMPKAPTAGNALIGVYGSLGTTLNPTVTGITVGAQADNWAVIGTAGSTTTDGYCTIWGDPSLTQASTAVVITSANGSGTVAAYGRVWEVAELLTTTTARNLLDAGVVGATTGGSQSVFALTAATTSAANDFAVGAGMFNRASIGAVNPMVAAPWISAYSSATPGGVFAAGATSYGFAGPKGASFPYTVTTNPQSGGAAFVAQLFASATPVAAPAFPFSVFIDQQQWDIQTTTPGTGYTYSLGQSPLYLRTGQHLEVLWTGLPFATYATYAPYLKCTAYFRYDPTAQQSGSVTGHA